MIRLVRKSYNAVSRYGFKEFIKRLFVFFDRKLRPGKYYHLIGESSLKRLTHNAKRTTQNVKRVLFISGEPKNATSYYRCEIPAKQLETQGWQVDIVYEAFTTKINPRDYSHIVFYRTPLNDLNQRILDIAKKNKIKTLFSIDDFVYRSDLIANLDYYKNLDPADAKRLIDRADSMIELMKLVDDGISSTNYLAGDMKKYIKGEVFVLRNGYKDRCDTLYDERKSRGVTEKIVLGYFSGSETHDGDIDLIFPSLVKLFDKYPCLELRVGGRFNYDFGDFTNRIKKLPFVPRDKFMKLMSGVDINLLPLKDKEFNRGKSEIKFTEAALLGIVTVASNVGDLSKIIKHAETGFLAKNIDDWYEIISDLMEKREKINEIGQNARGYVVEKYAIEKSGKKFVDFLRK